MLLEETVKLDFSDVLIKPKRSSLRSRKDVELHRDFGFFHGIPIMAANMDGVGTFAMADVFARNRMLTCLVKTYSTEALIDFFAGNNNSDGGRTRHVALSIGASSEDREKFQKVYSQIRKRLRYVCIDVANGYSEYFVEFLKKFKGEYPDIIIIAGNVCTPDQTQQLLLNGVDIVKCGIGPGSVCTTRIKTGVGYPQLSTIIECADVAHGLGGYIIADGGCTTPGDVSKAFGAGADFVMLGGMLAGHDQGSGDIISRYLHEGEYIKDETTNEWKPLIIEKKFVHFYGMSSETANKKNFGGLKEYRASEGREVEIPYRGDVQGTLQDLLGGVRSTCTYVGAKNIKALPKCTTFIRVRGVINRVYERYTTLHENLGLEKEKY